MTECDRVLQPQVTSSFDIYYDPLVDEAVRCRPVLLDFRSRVVELLAQWEEHPTLNELVALIDRIMDFPVTSPIIKFVTGLELLVQKAQVRTAGGVQKNWTVHLRTCSCRRET